jgi:tocopherol cyclase
MVRGNLRTLWNPELFQGTKTYRNYFEGWYFKLVDASEEHILAVIPGIALGKTKSESHAFIQLLNGKTGDFEYFTCSIDDFIPSQKRFEVTIGDNYFSADTLNLNLTHSHRRIRGELTFENLVPFPKKFLSPGVMGWGAFIPFMQCKHGVVSVNHTIHGTLEIDGARIAFTGGKGYTEKDWGHSFPSAYIWMQSNHFKTETEAMSFMLSIARIPWLRITFSGFVGVLWYKGRFYTFATYTGARITQFEKGENRARITIEDKHFVLAIDAAQERVWELKSPFRGTMTRSIFESLTSTLNLRLYEKTRAGKRLLIEDQGRNAGLEIMDATNELVHDLTK